MYSMYNVGYWHGSGLDPLGCREAHAVTNFLYEGWAYLPLTVWIYVAYYFSG